MSAPASDDFLGSRHVSMGDIHYVEAATLACRVKDYRDGGGSCLDTVLAHIARSHTLIRAKVPAVLADRLYTAVADLHNIAGWICFDAGLVPDALRFLTQASQWAQRGRNSALAANISYRLGRIWLHHNAPDRALTEFQLGQIHASTAASPLAESVLSINQAWAYARLGAEEPALALVNQATDYFARADTASAPPWAAFFTANDLQATSGVVHTELARTIDIRYTRYSIPALTTAIAGNGPDMARSKAFCMIALAIGHLLTVRGLVAAGIGVARAPLLTLTTLPSDVVAIPLDEPSLIRTVLAALPASRYRLPAAVAMVDALRHVSSKL